MTILLFERLPVAAGHEAAFEGHVAKLLAVMRGAPGILWADAARALDDGSNYIVVSEWRTSADAEAWGSSAEASAWATGADALLRGDVTRRFFRA